MPLSVGEKNVLVEILRHHDMPHLKTSADDVIRQYSRLIYITSVIQWGSVVLFLALGLLAAPLAFDASSSQKVNIFWLLSVLLGAHFLSLIIWTLSFTTGRQRSSYLKSLISICLKQFAKWAHIPDMIVDTFMRIRFAESCGKWFLARLMHTMWGAYLIGGLISAIFFLMTHQVHFVWETTLLTSQDFATLTQLLSIIPEALGMAVPTLSDIHQSRIDQVVQPEDMRRMWAIWVLGCVLIYGVAIRVTLAGISHLYWLAATRRRINALGPITVTHSAHSTTIIDPDGDARPIADQPDIPLRRVSQLPYHDQYFLFEWSKPHPLALKDAHSLETINSAQEQQLYLRSPEPNCILIDSTLSPDRGSLRFLRQTAATCRHYYLIGPPFQKDWQAALINEGILADTITELVE